MAQDPITEYPPSDPFPGVIGRTLQIDVDGALEEVVRPGAHLVHVVGAKEPGVTLVDKATVEFDRLATAAHKHQLGYTGGLR